MQAMRILVISDIHANLTALQAVIDDSAKHNSGDDFESVWCLGDTVGYGPDPNECVELIMGMPGVMCLIGNHDQAAIGLSPLSRFNQDARAAASWTSNVLSDESVEYLRSLPSEITIDGFTLAHGSPRQPVWEYILDPKTAKANFQEFSTDFCLVGHTHLPLIFEQKEGGNSPEPVLIPWGETMQLTPRMIINPGSVGQPRDMNPRAAYAVLDLEEKTWEPRRVSYDVNQVQLRMLEKGLPEKQALRLVAGW
jgi:predicted phosphodiesterase